MKPFDDSLQYGGSAPQHPRYAEIRAKPIGATCDAMPQKKGLREALGDAATFANALLAGG